jgi:hypothetical protein
METVCGLAHKLRAEEEKIKFGFNKSESKTEENVD